MVELVLVVDADNVKLSDATTPFGMAVLFRPQSRHVIDPAALVQLSDLLAESGPALKVTEEKSVVE